MPHVQCATCARSRTVVLTGTLTPLLTTSDRPRGSRVAYAQRRSAPTCRAALQLRLVAVSPRGRTLAPAAPCRGGVGHGEGTWAGGQAQGNREWRRGGGRSGQPLVRGGRRRSATQNSTASRIWSAPQTLFTAAEPLVRPDRPEPSPGGMLHDYRGVGAGPVAALRLHSTAMDPEQRQECAYGPGEDSAQW